MENRMKKAIAILLVVLFLVTVTASAVSAKSASTASTTCHGTATSTSYLDEKNSAGSNHDYANFVKPGEKPK